MTLSRRALPHKNLILARSWLDLLLDCGIWREEVLFGKGKDSFKAVWSSPKVSEILLAVDLLGTRIHPSSRAEFKRKLKAKAIRFSRNVDPLEPLVADRALEKEGTYEIRYGGRVIFIAIPPPWKASLVIHLCRRWAWLDNFLADRAMKRGEGVMITFQEDGLDA